MKMPAPSSSWVRQLRIPTPFPVGPTNCWLILREPVTLIDAGPETPEAAAALEAALADNGITASAIERLLLTHGHHDHFGAGAWLARKSPRMTVFGSPKDARHFRKDRNMGALRVRLGRSGVPPAVQDEITGSIESIDRFASVIENLSPLHGGESLEGDGYRIEIVSTPGHTPGSLSFRIVDSGDEADLLVTGDTVLARITPNAVIDTDPDDPAREYSSLSHYVRTLESIAEMKPGRLLTGHGDVIDDYPVHLIRQRKLQQMRREQILRHLSAGRPLSAWDLMQKVFPAVLHFEFFLAYSEVLGNLMWLEDRAEVVRGLESGVELFRVQGDAFR